ncbi:Os01g0497100 [Oryza sativa Japonica Group]|uniref:Os01g0497100 protein n=1 Tax=Oryza sativa subsp. japonica TaxID=39947 RepID=C7IXN1_ORYSJ|nr:Os01g0497100 [Oryza sativa Japonica Group]|eukprot:NP_001172368.1 Os01g0497100 [Oryza sativa Japonica Group]
MAAAPSPQVQPSPSSATPARLLESRSFKKQGKQEKRRKKEREAKVGDFLGT